MRSLGKTVHQRYRQVQYQGIFVGRSVLKVRVPRTRLQKPKRTNRQTFKNNPRLKIQKVSDGQIDKKNVQKQSKTELRK